MKIRRGGREGRRKGRRNRKREREEVGIGVGGQRWDHLDRRLLHPVSEYRS